MTVPNLAGLDLPLWLLSQVKNVFGRLKFSNLFHWFHHKKQWNQCFFKIVESASTSVLGDGGILLENFLFVFILGAQRTGITARDGGPTRHPDGHRFFFWLCHTGFNFPRYVRPPTWLLSQLWQPLEKNLLLKYFKSSPTYKLAGWPNRSIRNSNSGGNSSIKLNLILLFATIRMEPRCCSFSLRKVIKKSGSVLYLKF